MTQDEMIELAVSNGFFKNDEGTITSPFIEDVDISELLLGFAEDVATKEREVCTAAAMTAAEEAIEFAIKLEREACHALRQTLPNPHTNCQVSAHAYDMAIVEYGRAIRARGEA